MIKHAGWLLLAAIFSLGCLQANAGAAPAAADGATGESPAPGSSSVSAQEFSRKGADTCLKCHDEEAEYPVENIFKTKHGIQADSRTPFATLDCETCHGPGGEGQSFMEKAKEAGSHVGKVRPGDERPPIVNFGVNSDEPVAIQNRACLQCHAGDQHIAWQGSAHETGDVACASCHTIHVVQDPVLDKATQPEVCYRCHLKQRAEFLKPSNHPVRFGQLGCSDCHAPHGSAGTTLLARPTLNETCYTCHADKRGPFLWEHAPASEDCTLCHTPHGSIHPSLLKKRPPLLCQQCHAQGLDTEGGHPGAAHTATGLAVPGATPSRFLLAGGCTNCHSQVHGTNHPSGATLRR